MGREFLHKNRCLLAEGRSHLSPVFKKTLKASLLEHWILPARYPYGTTAGRRERRPRLKRSVLLPSLAQVRALGTGRLGRALGTGGLGRALSRLSLGSGGLVLGIGLCFGL